MDTNLANGARENVVLIADLIALSEKESVDTRRDLEKSDQETINYLMDAIIKLRREVILYKDPQELAENALQHKNDIVLSIFGGERSRNRMALVPAICESFGLSYIGPDVYGRIVAQDKEVSKRLALDSGLRTPSWRIIRDIQEISILARVNYPCVIKPLFEGSSIGISQSNLVYESQSADRIVRKLLVDMNQPILVEDFVPGREVALSVIESNGKITWGYSEVIIEGKPDFFENALFDAEEKISPTQGRTVRNIDDELDAADCRAIEQFLRAFGAFGYCRVDGRHAEGKFHFIEMTPDAWINPRGQFAMAYIEKGWTYCEVIETVLASKA